MKRAFYSKFDFTVDYPVGEHTRQGGKVKVKAHERGEGKLSEEELAMANIGKGNTFLSKENEEERIRQAKERKKGKKVGGSKKEEILKKAEKLKEKRIREEMEKGNTRKIAERKVEDEESKKKPESKKEVPKKEKSITKLKEKKAKVQKQLKKDPTNKFLQQLLKKLMARIVARIGKTQKENDFSTYDFFTMDNLIDFYDSIRENIQEHIDFVEDVSGLSNLTPEDLEKVLSLEKEIQEAGRKAITPKTPGWNDQPMTAVESSFIKGAGSYKGKILLEFHHDPGTIYGYDVSGQGGEFFQELMDPFTPSKGGWVWDKLLGKPSEFGMAKGTFHAYKGNNGQWNYYTSPGAQFVHKYGRPSKFTYNPVGYSTNEELYNLRSKIWKEEKEKLVEPPTSREAIKISKLASEESRIKGLSAELGVMFENLGKTGRDFSMNNVVRSVVRRVDLTEDIIVKILDEHGAKEKINLVKAVAPATEPDYVYITYTDWEGEEIVIEVDTKKILELARDIEKREIKKGRGWHGEPERHAKARKTGKADFNHIVKITKLGSIKQRVHNRGDTIPLSEFKQLKEDFTTSDFVMFHGAVARSGPYKYKKNGEWITLYKDIENLEDMYSRYDYLPLKASVKQGAHYAEELGFGYNFTVNHDTDEIEADLILLDEKQFKNILNKKEEYHVSPGYNDIVEGDLQIITDLDHIALALGNETARACTGTNEKGASCTLVKKIHDQNLKEVVLN